MAATPDIRWRIEGKRHRASIETALASLLWETSFVAVKIGLEHLDPVWFVEWRLLVASAILLFIYRILYPQRTLAGIRAERCGFNSAGDQYDLSQQEIDSLTSVSSGSATFVKIFGGSRFACLHKVDFFFNFSHELLSRNII